MSDRPIPYGSFNFLVSIDGVGPGAAAPLGGFSDVSGISSEFTVAEYRNGNERENHVRKVPGLHKVSDVTLKRGVINSMDLWNWIEDVRLRGPAGKRDVTVTILDEAGQAAQNWKLRGAIPLKYNGPAFAAKGTTDVAVEELVLSIEGMIVTRG